jgi:allantoate deiminase
MPVSTERVRADIEAIARCTSTPGAGASRPTFSPAWAAARAYVVAQAESAGCVVRTDAAGNVHARPAGLSWDEPAWLVGSHIDSVPHGGDYDGVAGVVVGLELLRSAKDEGIPPIPVELIAFAEEEGPTFGLGMLGSRAWAGELSAEQLGQLRNAAGETYLQAGVPYGVDAARLPADRLDPSKFLGLIEAHIEQGPGMWRRGQPLAIVRSIAGRRQYRVSVLGEANHAGATAMEDRADALAAAAEMVLRVEQIAVSIGQGAVATVGRLEVQPNAINVIPDRVAFTIDLRGGDDELIHRGHMALEHGLRSIAEQRRVKIAIESTENAPARPMAPRLVQALQQAAGGAVPITVSGALHDSAILAPYLPTVMLFVPSRDGISHNPAEFSRVEDIAQATAVIERVVRRPTIARLSAMDLPVFLAAVGAVFEHSPWIAERAWQTGRPFTSISDLHQKLCRVVAVGTADEQLGLIRAHPDLVGRLAREGRLTRESTAEQAAAGLSALSPDEITAFETHNAAYRERFGFPFVICARENRKEAILAAFPLRLRNTREAEIETALGEIYKIARLRLADAIWEP